MLRRLPMVMVTMFAVGCADGVVTEGGDFEDADPETLETATVTQEVRCAPRMNTFPVGAAHNIGYEHLFIHEVYDFITQLKAKKVTYPTFADGVQDQRVMDAVEKAAKTKKWVTI